ncbi:extracellular solute-binding protein [Nonomuraea sp. NPDC050328]|uniref:extracellular solute-binding protein n=1 Tax=Nonomuraea sp. NPDC050328 TaxID=3364361 RepID=UPI0037AD43E7
MRSRRLSGTARRAGGLAVAVALLASTAAGQQDPAPTPPGSASPSAGPTTAPTTAPPSSSPSPGSTDGTLDILAYKGFAEYGANSPKVNWVTGATEFQGVTGCRTARLDFVQTPEEMADKLATHTYDIVSAAPELAASLVAAQRVQPIDTARVSGYADLPAQLKETGVRDGATYAVPYLWGSYETVYDTTRIKKPKAEELYTSARAMVRDTPLTLGHAAQAFGLDPMALDQAGLDELGGKLAGVRRSTYTLQLDVVSALASGRVDYAQVTPFLLGRLQAAGKPVKKVKTARTTGWVDSWMLGAGTPNLDCAYRWLSWTLTPHVQEQAAAWLALAPANPKGCTGAAKEACRAYRLEKVDFLGGARMGCAPQRHDCTDYTAWAERWQSLVN